MNVTIDIGNTATKVGLFQEDKLISKHIFKGELSQNQLVQLLANENVTHVILSSVIHHSPQFEQFLVQRYKAIVLTHKTLLPFQNNYATPETLGKDRIAVVAGAVGMFGNSPILIMDAGTCIKYEFVAANKVYLGGAISPGMHMRFKALNDYTAQLPLVSPQDEVELVGDSTKHSILSGVMKGIENEMTGYIHAFQRNHPDGKVILTGGDANYFGNAFKNNIFALPDLQLIGLNNILIIN